MANLIIKPTSGGSLILQDEGGTAAITVAAAGTTTFAENLTLSGTGNNLGTVTAGTITGGTIGSAVVQPDGAITNYFFNRQINSAAETPTETWTAVANSSFSYTPTAGATWVKYNCRINVSNKDARAICMFRIAKDGTTLDYSRITLDSAGTDSEFDSAAGWTNIDTMIPYWSGAATLQAEARIYSGTYEAYFHYNANYQETDGSASTVIIYCPTETTIYSVM